MDALTLLHSRNSAPRLTEPAPAGQTLDDILQAGLRAPDHARLRPWRFLTISGEGRNALGALFVEAANRRKHADQQAPLSADEAARVALKPLRAPLIVVVVAAVVEHPKVPAVEQLISAGCSAHGILLAAHALGFAGVWRTGSNAFDKTVNQGLGLADHESIVGFIYLGTIAGDYKPLPVLSLEDYCQPWPAADAPR